MLGAANSYALPPDLHFLDPLTPAAVSALESAATWFRIITGVTYMLIAMLWSRDGYHIYFEFYKL